MVTGPTSNGRGEQVLPVVRIDRDVGDRLAREQRRHVRPRDAAVAGAVEAVAVLAVTGERTLTRSHVDDVVVVRGNGKRADRLGGGIRKPFRPRATSRVVGPDAAAGRAEDERAVLADRQRTDATGHRFEGVAGAADLHDRARPVRRSSCRRPCSAARSPACRDARLVRRADRARVVGEQRTPVVRVTQLLQTFGLLAAASSSPPFGVSSTGVSSATEVCAFGAACADGEAAATNPAIAAAAVNDTRIRDRDTSIGTPTIVAPGQAPSRRLPRPGRSRKSLLRIGRESAEIDGFASRSRGQLVLVRGKESRCGNGGGPAALLWSQPRRSSPAPPHQAHRPTCRPERRRPRDDAAPRCRDMRQRADIVWPARPRGIPGDNGTTNRHGRSVGTGVDNDHVEVGRAAGDHHARDVGPTRGAS